MFKSAEPIWITGKEREMNVYAVFQTEVPAFPELELHIAGTAFYRIYVNGKFLAFGPARTAKGYLREDVFLLKEYVGEEAICNIVIEACGYYCKSISTVLQPSCIIAEVQKEGMVLAYSGRDFTGYLPWFRLQETDRMSIQRHFTEVWDYRACKSLCDESYKAEVSVLSEAFTVLDRRAPYAAYEDIDLTEVQCYGTYEFDETRPYKATRWTWKVLPEDWGYFDRDKMKYKPFEWVYRQKQTILERGTSLPITLKKGEYAIFDFGRIEAGFINSALKALEESDIIIAFSELYEGDEFKYPTMSGHYVLEYLLAANNRRELLSFEPYTFRYVIVMVKEGSIQLDSFGVKTYIFDTNCVKSIACDNELQSGICQAAVRTFAHNAVDVYMDCPSRERAGWLCDSYFTAKAEWAMTGQTLVEDAFLENFRLFENDGSYFEGAIPDCYPSDARPKEFADSFIPQWTMWYILESAEYILERGHKDMAEEFRKSIYGLLDFYKRYENEDGLLERLPAWNFVEWSKANEWVMDVNYPTNFLYAGVLDAIYRIYGDEECRERCAEVRKKAIEQSFNGKYFLDHAIRDEKGVLAVQPDDCSEACQYYALLFAGIDINDEKYAYFKQLILEVFSPNRNGAMPEIFEVNAFIGAYLRMDSLLKMKEYTLVLKNVEEFFGHMAKYTGTLWEYREFKGSHDHGFASYVYAVIKEALEGLEKQRC